MNDIFIAICFLVGAILLIAIIAFSIYFISYRYEVNVQKANMIEIYCNSVAVPIYAGKSAFVDIQSGGMTTTIIIYKKLFPLPVVKEIYSGPNIRVEPTSVLN
jgi:hypothetical protein